MKKTINTSFLSKRTTFDKQLHRQYLSQLLIAIFKDKFLSENFIFKGGTALYFFHNLSRFSTDLDFDFTKPLSSEKTSETYERLIKIARNLNLNIKDSTIKKHTIFLELSYKAKHRKLKIEVSRRPYKNLKHEIKNFLGIPIRVLTPECMLSYKLVAVSSRRKNTAIARDIFDLWFMLTQKKWLPDKEFFQELSEKILNTSPENVITKAIETVQKFPSPLILQGIGETLAPEIFPFIRKEKIKNELDTFLRTLLLFLKDLAEEKQTVKRYTKFPNKKCQ